MTTCTDSTHYILMTIGKHYMYMVIPGILMYIIFLIITILACETAQLTESSDPAGHLLPGWSHEIICPVFSLDVKNMFVLLVKQVGMNRNTVL